jgi:predicted permease
MTILYRIRALVRWLFRRDQIERALDTDINDYIERSAAEKMRTGMSEVEARRAARNELGGVEQTKDSVRAALSFAPIENTLTDLRLALRTLSRQKTFTSVAVLTLALGIGVNTAVFSVVNEVLLKPVRVEDPERLVFVMNKSNDGVPITIASPLNFTHWRAETGVFESVAAWRNVPLDYSAGDTPETVTVGTVSADYFRVLRAPFVAGRGFLAGDDEPGAAGIAVISHRFWTDRLGGAADAVGRTISLSGRAYTVVGIAARDFDVGELVQTGAGRTVGNPQLWVPLAIDSGEADEALTLSVLARLKEGVALAQAQERLTMSLAEYRERYPGSFEGRSDNPNHGFTALAAHEVVVDGAQPTLSLLAGAVAFVLLIACANVASLLLVRATQREREIAIRAALGAGRGRIVRELLAESVLLSIAGGALGLVAGIVGVRALLAVDTTGLPRLATGVDLLGLDWRVAGFALCLSLATGLTFGLAPALAGSRTGLNAVINHASRGGGGVRGVRARRVLVAVEIGLAVVLVIGSVLLIRTMIALGAVDLGFPTQRLVAMRTTLSDARFESTANAAAIVDTALERVRALPEVEAAAASCCVPSQNSMSLPFDLVEREQEEPYTGIAVVAPVSAGYFEALGLALLAGRVLDERDGPGAPPVAVIDRAMAERYWADGTDPLGSRIVLGGGADIVPESRDEPPRQIVGIVSTMRAHGIHAEAQPTIYFPLAQTSNALNAAVVQSSGLVAWLVRTRSTSAAMAGVIREEISRATGELTTGVVVMDQVLTRETAPHRFRMWLMGVFGGAALLLAAIGIYGLIANAVEQRRHEIGIRMALGAPAYAVRRMVIGDGMLPVAIGIAAGLVAAYFLANVLAAMLFGVEPRDAGVFAGVAVILAGVAFAAAAVPAFRASRVSPMVALREE